jgi:hypothetical protein
LIFFPHYVKNVVKPVVLDSVQCNTKTAIHWHESRSSGEKRMDVAKILVELRQEREQIEEAILSLERLARGRGRRRGRPPSWMAEITAKRRGRPPGSKNKSAPKSASATTIG